MPCVQALLRAKANTELLDGEGHTALWGAEEKGHTATAALIQQHAACLSLGLGVALCAVVPLAWPWLVLSVVLGAIATVAFSRTLTTGPSQHRALMAGGQYQAARQRRPHRLALYAKARGRTTTAEPIRQHAAPPQPTIAEAPHVIQAAQAARAVRADAAMPMEELLAEEVGEQAKLQPPSKKSKKKKKAGHAVAAGDEPSEAPPAAAPAPPPAAAPKPAASAAKQAEAALRAAIAGGGLSALEVAPREVRKGSVGAEARTRCDRLLKAQQKAEREAKQGVSAETARLAAAVRAAAAFKAREEAVAAAAALAAARKAAVAAVAKADARDRATGDDGEGGSNGATSPSVASGSAEVPDEYICPITAEIMNDPVSTMDGFTYERAAITEWLRTNNTSPSTGALLESTTLIPNHLIRSLLRAFTGARTVPSTASP